MAGKVVTTAAPTREETAAARSYVGSARASGNGLNVKEKAGSDASKVNYYRGSGAASSISATPAQRQQYNQRMDNARLWAQTDEIRGYLNSGQTNRQSTNQWLETANTEAQNAKSEDAKNHWANIANALNSQLKSDYWNELETTKTELSKAQEAEATIRKNRDNASIATTSGVKFVDGRDSFAVLKEANQQLAQNVNSTKELSARLEALQAEFEDRFKPDEVRQAEARLTANRGYVTEYGDEMTDVKAADQALVDEWRASMGLNPKYFNTQDKIDAFARSKFFGLASGAMNTAAVGLQWLDQSSDEMVRAQYDAEHGEGAYDKAVAGKNVNVLGDAGRSLNKAAINANEDAQRDIAKIKQDMSKFGQFGVDLASTALDVGFDAASGLGLVSMGVRTFGQSALEAQARGADLSGQIKYGLANTAIELATEKISDGLGLVYGKGVSTDITEKAIEKLAKTKAGADLLRFIAGAGGEGIEEVVSDLLSPFANWIIDEQARNDKVYDVDPSELLYDFLLGAAVGAFGQAGEVATGEYAAKDQEINRNRAIENQKAVADYDAKFQSRVSELIKNEGMTQAQAEAQATEEMGEAPTLSAGNSAASKIEAIDSLFSQLEQITPDKVAEFRDSLPDEARLTREEFDAAVEMGLLDEVDAPNYLAKGEATSSGEGVESRLDGEVEARKEDEDGNPINRMRRLTERIASAFGRLGYGNTANKGEAYQTATGKTIEQANAEADAASWDAAHANETNVAGGDSASKNLSNYDQAGLNKLWKDHTLTSGQYAEAMVRRGFWSEKMARNFLSTARQNGASAAERKRDLGGFTIGPENAVNAPNSQESPEGTNTPEAPAQEVKPAEESATEPPTPEQESSTTEETDSEREAPVPEGSQQAGAEPELNLPQAESENPQSEASPTGSGTVKESTSAALRQQATRGEENAVRQEGNTSFVSKTNEERSRIADHVIGETEDSLTKAVNGLLSKDERWNDQDVVTAERAMYKMVRAIRDYQLGNSRKLPRSAFNALIKRYNDLATRHINEKSAAGQELQATYQFTPEEQIMDRMAKTFLGFTKDGRFAGEAPLAVNAKIYGAAEDAVNRITKAREAGDAKALAQVCKDISDVRGIKKMFGPASEFASKMENEILNAIAGQENGVEALNTLALGNLNAICDDVQPYKIVNAAKTIRVMNMLSNMSTIVNNITNNIASGLTSTNALSQGASLLASKAFENITGQTVLTPAAKGWIANKEIRNAEMEALKMATLVQMYGINQENGRLELKGDKGLFNPNANAFEQTMALYKFFIGMGVEATDQVKSEGLTKAMNIGIDKALASGKITEKQAEQMREEARHEVNRLLYKDDNRLSGFVQGVRNRLNKAVHWGNDDIGTIGLGDIAMAFAKIPANVVRARLYATPEGCLLQLGQYAKGVMKAKRMHSEYQARLIAENYAPELQKLRSELADAEELEAREVGREEREAKISEVKAKLTALNNKMWAEAREKCSGSVYNKLTEKRDNYSANLSFDDAVQRCGYSEATEMSQFEAATYSRKIGKAATSAGMVALGAILRGLGALRDFDQEPDEELRKMYKQKGYTGLMFNWSAIGRKDHEWKDGDIVLSADFLEVVALPLTIGACARECAMNVEGKGKTKAFVLEAGYGGLNKVFESVGDIPGMADAINLYNAVTSQFNTDNRAKGLRVFNAGVEYLANTLPSFFIPNAYTQLGAGLDNTVRDTYTTDNIWQQAGNIALNKTAFLRRKIPASVDMWGEERRYGENKFWGVVNKTLLPGDRIKFRQNKYEEEILRLTKAGFKGATPKISVNGSFEVDGETYTLDADEKREFKENRNKAQAEVYQAVMDSDLYAQLTDEQKVAVLRDMKMDCERNAKQAVLIGRGLDAEVTRAKWETELETEDQITYLSKMQMAKAAWDSSEGEVSDYAAMDTFIQNQYGPMSQTMKDIADNSLTHLDDLYDAWNTAKITSEDWQTAYNIYRQYIATDENGKRVYKANLANEAEMWSKIEKATGANKSQMAWYEEKMKLWYQGTPDTDQYYEYLNDAGLSRSEATTTIQTMSSLEALEGYSSVQYGQKYQVIVQTVPKAKQWDAFWSLVPSNASKAKVKKMHALQAQGVSLDTALKSTGMGDYYTKYVDTRGKAHKTKVN